MIKQRRLEKACMTLQWRKAQGEKKFKALIAKAEEEILELQEAILDLESRRMSRRVARSSSTCGSRSEARTAVRRVRVC